MTLQSFTDRDRLRCLTTATHTYNSGVVVVGEHPLTQGHEEPERLLLLGVEKQHRGDDVHGLREERGSRQPQSANSGWIFTGAILVTVEGLCPLRVTQTWKPAGLQGMTFGKQLLTPF